MKARASTFTERNTLSITLIATNALTAQLNSALRNAAFTMDVFFAANATIMVTRRSAPSVMSQSLNKVPSSKTFGGILHTLHAVFANNLLSQILAFSLTANSNAVPALQMIDNVALVAVALLLMMLFTLAVVSGTKNALNANSAKSTFSTKSLPEFVIGLAAIPATDVLRKMAVLINMVISSLLPNILTELVVAIPIQAPDMEPLVRQGEVMMNIVAHAITSKLRENM